MSTENTQVAASTGGTGVESTGTTVDTTVQAAVETATTQTATPGSKDLLQEGASTMPGAGVVDPTKPVVPAYTPNYKYKAAMQEKELDAFWHPLIKDAESEKKVKDIFTRVEAFDYMKDKLDKREMEYSSLYKDFETQAKLVQKVTQARQSGDLDSVFRNIGINDHEILQWAAKKIDYLETMRQLPPDQRAAFENQQKAALKNEAYEEQLAQMRADLQAQATQARVVQLEMTLSRPEVSQSAQVWDEKMGYQGAFKDAVIEEAQKYWMQTYQQTGQGVDLTPEQATERVLKRFANFLNNGGTMQSAPMTQSQQPPAGMQAMQEKPVIPVINGTSKTPIKKQIRSIEDIKKRAKELESQQGF